MKKLLAICAIIGVLFGATIDVHAAVYGVTSRQDLAGNDYVDWGQFGTPYGWGKWAGPNLFIPVSAKSSNGIRLNLTNPPYNSQWTMYMKVRQQSLSWGGNFAPYDILIGNMWDGTYPLSHGPGPMTINLDEPVFGLGVQINAFNYGTFNAIIEAFDSEWKSLGQVSFSNLLVAYTSDNSAPFIGILSDNRNISHVVIAKGRGAFVINQLDLVTNKPTIPGTAIPSNPGSGGIMLARCETISEYKIAQNSSVTSVQTNGFSGTIYTTNGTYTIGGNPANSLPMVVKIDGVSASLTDLEGADVKEIKVISNICDGFDPASNLYASKQQLTVLATLNNNGGGGGGNGGNGGQQTKEFEGFIESIAAIADALEVTVGKEGKFVTVIVDNRTKILINGQPASMNVLQAGAKAKAQYDSSNNHASQLMVEGG